MTKYKIIFESGGFTRESSDKKPELGQVLQYADKKYIVTAVEGHCVHIKRVHE